MSELKQNEQIIDFDQLDESQYESLKSCDMLKFSYPFCKGTTFKEDLELYKTLK